MVLDRFEILAIEKDADAIALHQGYVRGLRSAMAHIENLAKEIE